MNEKNREGSKNSSKKIPGSDKRKPNTLIRFSGIAIQMGVTIFLGAYVGKWLDQKYPADKNWFTIVLTLLAVAIALYNVLRQVNKYNEE